MEQSTAILVLSCDKYSDVWNPFFQFFNKYWKNCPFPVYLGTNDTLFHFENVKQIFSHKNTTWSDELETILYQIPHKNIIIILEDYFIYDRVDNEELFRIIDVMEQQNAAYVKLGAFPKKYDELWPYKLLSNYTKLGVIEKGAKYRLSLQTALWNKDVLLKLLNKKENPWQFELEASKRSNLLENPFLLVVADPKQTIVHGPIPYYCTALSAGKWMRGAIRLCNKENIEVDLTVRSVETFCEEFKRKFYILLPLSIRKIFDYMSHKIKMI